MKHTTLAEHCKSLGLCVRPDPFVGHLKAYSAGGGGVRVYWRCSTEGTVVGLPRVMAHGRDTHARNLKEVSYLVTTR